jgi:hypothetical protein
MRTFLMTDSEKGEKAMRAEERKAIARLAHEAINHRNLARLSDHPG